MILDYEREDVILTVPTGGTTAQRFGNRFDQNCKHLIIKAPSSTAKYSVQIDFTDGLPFRRMPDVGDFRGNAIKDLDLVLAGVFNVHIQSDTAGTFILRFVGIKIRI